MGRRLQRISENNAGKDKIHDFMNYNGWMTEAVKIKEWKEKEEKS